MPVVLAAAVAGWVAGWLLDGLAWPVGGGLPRWRSRGCSRVPLVAGTAGGVAVGAGGPAGGGLALPWGRGPVMGRLWTAAAWAAVAWRSPDPLAAVPGWLLAATVVAAAVSDLETRRVPNGLVAGAALAWLPASWLAGSGWATAVGGALLLGGAMLAAGLMQRGAMGAGDVKLAAVAGLYLGWPRAAAAFVLVALVGAAAGSALLLANLRSRRDLIPFAPFIALGVLGALLFGGELIRWYLGQVLHWAG